MKTYFEKVSIKQHGAPKKSKYYIFLYEDGSGCTMSFDVKSQMMSDGTDLKHLKEWGYTHYLNEVDIRESIIGILADYIFYQSKVNNPGPMQETISECEKQAREWLDEYDPQTENK